jgi:hypothetical protein
MVTVNVLDTGLSESAASVAVQVTVVVVIANVLPDGGTHTAAGGSVGLAWSVTAGAV